MTRQCPRFLRNVLGEVLPQVRTEMEHVLDTAVSGLWTDFVLPHIGAGAAEPRHEEAIFLRHLRASEHWERVPQAVAAHRERQSAFDVQDAIARTMYNMPYRRYYMCTLQKVENALLYRHAI